MDTHAYMASVVAHPRQGQGKKKTEIHTHTHTVIHGRSLLSVDGKKVNS